MSGTPSTWLHHAGQCVDGPPTSDHHDIEGKDRDRCDWHANRYGLWEGRRYTAVSRARTKAREGKVPFDRQQTVTAWEAANPYELRRRPDTARGAMPVPPLQVRQLRTTLTELLQAKTALDAGHRDDTQMTPREQLRLLKAIERHSTLLDGLLGRAEQQ